MIPLWRMNELLEEIVNQSKPVTFSLSIFLLPLCQTPSKTITQMSVTPVCFARYSYSHFVERFKHPSAQAVVNEIRDFVNEFPANLTRLQAARRIHHFLGQVTPKLLQVGRVGNGAWVEKFVKEMVVVMVIIVWVFEKKTWVALKRWGFHLDFLKKCWLYNSRKRSRVTTSTHCRWK